MELEKIGHIGGSFPRDEETTKNPRHPTKIWFDAMQNHFLAYYDPHGNDGLAWERWDVSPIDGKMVGAGSPLEMKYGLEQTRPLMMAKLSLDHSFLALQLDAHRIRILSTNNSGKHWTLDLENEPRLVSYKESSSLLKRANTASSLATSSPRLLLSSQISPNKGQLILTFIWSDHGGSSQDLSVITDRGMLCYKISSITFKMSATHQFPQETDRFWWEPKSRCIVLGSVNDQLGSSFTMRPYFLLADDHKSQSNTTFPRLELPPPVKLSPFSVSARKERISLLNLYGTAYCLELKDDKSLVVYQLDRKLGVVLYRTMKIPGVFAPDEHVLHAVSDNILLLFSDMTDKAVVVDIRETRTEPLVIKWKSEEMHGLESFTHSVFRRKDAAFRMKLNLQELSDCWMNADVSILPYLLRRTSTNEAQSVALQMFQILVNHSDFAQIRIFSQAIAQVYAPSVYNADCSDSYPLLFRCALLPTYSELRDDAVAVYGSQKHEPATSKWRGVLSQTSLLKHAVLGYAKKAIYNEDEERLEAVSDTLFELIRAFYQQCIPTIPALRLLFVAILWRTGHGSEVVASLSAQFRKDDNSNDAFGQMVLSVVKEIPLGCGCDDSRKFSKEHSRYQQAVEQLVTFNLSSNALARRLLDQGRVAEAIVVCSKTAHRRSHKQASVHDMVLGLKPAAGRLEGGVLRGEDFFRAAMDHMGANEVSMTVADRCRILYYLHKFLCEWDPSCLELEERETRPLRRHSGDCAADRRLTVPKSPKAIGMKGRRRSAMTDSLWHHPKTPDAPDQRKGSITVEQSVLAHEFPSFPDHLFGGSDSASCRKLRDMYGYRSN